MRRLFQLAALAALYFGGMGAALAANTWYIRLDGGNTMGCTGTVNAPYTGGITTMWAGNHAYQVGDKYADNTNRIQTVITAGTSGTYPPGWVSSGTTTDGTAAVSAGAQQPTGLPCALNHPFYLLNQGSFQWAIAPGDSVLFADTGPYYLGQALGGLGSYWPFCRGQESFCALPALPNNVSLLGFNHGSCHNPAHTALVNPTQLVGINQVFTAINLRGSVGADVECFDISQPSMCTRSGVGSIPSNLNCKAGTDNYIYNGGLTLSYLGGDNGPSDSTVRDLSIHGLADEAVTGGKMNQAGTTHTMTFSDIYLYGNANTGWDADAGGCTTNCESTGTINLSYINAFWSGCMEVKPNGGTIGQNGVDHCVDQTYNGNGDNIVMIATGGTWNWNHVTAKWGTQDCVDLLHTGDDINSGVVINMNDVDVEGCEGQQWKVGGTAAGTNMRVITNCNRLLYPFPPNPSTYNQYVGDTCRAFSGLALSVSPGHTITVTNSTIVGYANPEFDIDCYTNSSGCPANSYSVVLADDLTLGYVDPHTGTTPAGLYWGLELTNPFLNTGSSISHMLWAQNTLRASSGSGPASGCAQAPANETATVCADPLLVGEISPPTYLDNFNIALQAASPAIAVGSAVAGVTSDFFGSLRGSPYVIGAAVAGVVSAVPTQHNSGSISIGGSAHK